MRYVRERREIRSDCARGAVLSGTREELNDLLREVLDQLDSIPDEDWHEVKVITLPGHIIIEAESAALS